MSNTKFLYWCAAYFSYYLSFFDLWSVLFQVLCEEDEKAFEMFMSSDNVVKTTVAESLKEKLTAKQTELGSRMSGKSEHVDWVSKY